MTFYRITRRLGAILTALTLGACAAPAPAPLEIRSGVIEQINPTQIASNQHQGVGAVIGGLTGVGIGSLIGGGTGRDVAMVAGAVGGALVGNEVQKRNTQPIAGEQIIVRTTSGVLVVVTQAVGAPLRVGQKVFIQGYGESARVTAQ
ncbi:MAG: glycine zipper 2TM domain-containing protein [Ideonella sp.]|nr:glycine zipper 2TM domain-containing protein [Ideonella sp.]